MTTVRYGRLTEDLQRDKVRAAEILGDAVICAYCGATSATFEARCIADSETTCPGLEAYARALAAAARERRAS